MDRKRWFQNFVEANELGMEHLQLGMAHRGRLNVLVNFVGKRLKAVCSEFDEQNDLIGVEKRHKRCGLQVT